MGGFTCKQISPPKPNPCPSGDAAQAEREQWCPRATCAGSGSHEPSAPRTRGTNSPSSRAPAAGSAVCVVLCNGEERRKERRGAERHAVRCKRVTRAVVYPTFLVAPAPQPKQNQHFPFFFFFPLSLRPNRRAVGGGAPPQHSARVLLAGNQLSSAGSRHRSQLRAPQPPAPPGPGRRPRRQAAAAASHAAPRREEQEEHADSPLRQELGPLCACVWGPGNSQRTASERRGTTTPWHRQARSRHPADTAVAAQLSKGRTGNRPQHDVCKHSRRRRRCWRRRRRARSPKPHTTGTC